MKFIEKLNKKRIAILERKTMILNQ